MRLKIILLFLVMLTLNIRGFTQTNTSKDFIVKDIISSQKDLPIDINVGKITSLYVDRNEVKCLIETTPSLDVDSIDDYFKADFATSMYMASLQNEDFAKHLSDSRFFLHFILYDSKNSKMKSLIYNPKEIRRIFSGTGWHYILLENIIKETNYMAPIQWKYGIKLIRTSMDENFYNYFLRSDGSFFTSSNLPNYKKSKNKEIETWIINNLLTGLHKDEKPYFIEALSVCGLGIKYNIFVGSSKIPYSFNVTNKKIIEILNKIEQSSNGNK